ncbi:MAG: hypothetical protein K9N47_25080 [Prosthecobacter sp.]|uniref:hypothetical protein n=1 Tax=Prosthecobacter sp. TaxID=1965333 RepID=UPI002608FEE0|nr:hypothetical protein [Prosthecobacter sp.]MCF7789420.1 hypothetical protein [Prosthecobacter sp.]
MHEDYTPSNPSSAEAGGVFENLSEADASAVLDSLASAGGDAAGAASPSEVIPGLSSLDEALEGADLAQMTDAQVRDFESGDPERVEAALAAQMTPRAPGEESAMAPARVSIKALKPEDRARTVQALDLIRAGSSPAEAFAEAFGITGQAQAAEGDAQQDAPFYEETPDYSQAQAAVPQVAELEQHLSLLQQQYKQAKESYDPVASDIMEQMTDVKMDLREARREAAVVNNHWQGQQAESHTRAMDMFSDLITDEDTGFVNCCDDEIFLAEAKNDPILNHPDWPEKIGRRVIDKFFKGQAANSPGHARGMSLIPPAPRHSLRLPGSPVGPGFSAGALSPQTAMAEIDKLTPEQQDAFIHSLDKLTSAKVRH